MTSSAIRGKALPSQTQSVNCPQSPMPRALEKIESVWVLGSKPTLISRSSLGLPGARRLGKADPLQVPGVLVAEEEDADLVVGAHARIAAPRARRRGRGGRRCRRAVAGRHRDRSRRRPWSAPSAHARGSACLVDGRRRRTSGGAARPGPTGRLRRPGRPARSPCQPALLVVDPEQDRGAAGQRDRRPATCRRRQISSDLAVAQRGDQRAGGGGRRARRGRPASLPSACTRAEPAIGWPSRVSVQIGGGLLVAGVEHDGDLGRGGRPAVAIDDQVAAVIGVLRREAEGGAGRRCCRRRRSSP